MVYAPGSLTPPPWGAIVDVLQLSGSRSHTSSNASQGATMSKMFLSNFFGVLALLRTLSISCRSGTSTYKLQVKTGSRACIHVLPHTLLLQTSPPCQGGLRRCHMSHPGFEKMKLKPLHVCLGCSNHTYSNNTVNIYNILINYKLNSYKTTLASERRLQSKVAAEI
jgi:hypothetical protein